MYATHTPVSSAYTHTVSAPKPLPQLQCVHGAADVALASHRAAHPRYATCSTSVRLTAPYCARSDLAVSKLATWPACFSTLAALTVLNLTKCPTVAADGCTALPSLRRFRGPEALRGVLQPAHLAAATPAPQNSAFQPRPSYEQSTQFTDWVIPPSPSGRTHAEGSALSCAVLRDKIYGLVFGMRTLSAHIYYIHTQVSARRALA